MIKNLFQTKNNIKKYSTYEKIENLFDSLQKEVITIDLGEDLLQFKDSVIAEIGEIREQIKDECGFIMPPVELRANYAIQENEFNIFIQEKLVESRFAVPTENGLKEEIYEGIKNAIYNNLDIVFTNELTEKYINTVKKNNSILIWNVTNILSVVDIKTILSDIIFKGNSIQNINYIFEKIGEYVLSEGINNNSYKRFNPHAISQAISKYLYK